MKTLSNLAVVLLGWIFTGTRGAGDQLPVIARGGAAGKGRRMIRAREVPEPLRLALGELHEANLIQPMNSYPPEQAEWVLTGEGYHAAKAATPACWLRSHLLQQMHTDPKAKATVRATQAALRCERLMADLQRWLQPLADDGLLVVNRAASPTFPFMYTMVIESCVADRRIEVIACQGAHEMVAGPEPHDPETFLPSGDFTTRIVEVGSGRSPVGRNVAWIVDDGSERGEPTGWRLTPRPGIEDLQGSMPLDQHSFLLGVLAWTGVDVTALPDWTQPDTATPST